MTAIEVALPNPLAMPLTSRGRQGLGLATAQQECLAHSVSMSTREGLERRGEHFDFGLENRHPDALGRLMGETREAGKRIKGSQ